MHESISYTKLDDESKASLKRLLNQAYDVENSDKRLSSLIWTCQENPHAGENESRYYFIKANTETLAYNGRMPVNILVKGQPNHAYYVHETLVHADYRKKGLGIQVNKNVLEDSGGLCLGLWANEKLLPILLKVGWIKVGELRPLRKILRFDNVARYKFRSKPLRYLLLLLGGLYLKIQKIKRHKPLPGTRTYEITRFTEDMKQTLVDMMKEFPIIAYRSPDYLNWKYVDIPYRQYRIYGVDKNGIFKGYVVLRHQADPKSNLKKGMVVDLLCDPSEKDCFLPLLNKAEEYFSAKRTDFVVCMVTYDTFRKWLKKLGFYAPRPKIKDFYLLANIERQNDKIFLEDLSNWYLTYGDSDYDMLIGELNPTAR
jgi:hypothetical protein